MTNRYITITSLALALLAPLSVLGVKAQDAMDIKVQRVATTQEHWSVNAFILESHEGIVIVDALLLNSDVDNLVAIIESKNKPVLGLLVTHAHPDHVLGIPRLKEQFGQFPVYGTQHMSDIVASQVSQFKSGPLAANWGADVWQGADPVIDHIISTEEVLNLGGMEILAKDTGPGEAESTVVYSVPSIGAVFAGDILMPFHHYYVGEGKTIEVIQQLEDMAAEYAEARWIYPGHGEVVPPSFIVEQKRFVETMRDEYVRLSSNPSNVSNDSGALTREANRIFTEHLMAEFPGYLSFALNPYTFASWNVFGLAQQYYEKP